MRRKIPSTTALISFEAAARHESEPRLLVHDEIEMAHPVFLFLVRQAVKLFR